MDELEKIKDNNNSFEDIKHIDSVENFRERLKHRPEIFRVCLIDDNSDILKESIDQQIDCYVDSSKTLDVAEWDIKKDVNCFMRDYDVIFFDATYEGKHTSAISFLEGLISKNPNYADISRVMIGTDIMDYSKDYESRAFIGRIRELPNIIYGDGKGTKIENMIGHIQNEAKKKGVEVAVKQPKGTCRPEILEKVKPFIYSVYRNLKEQQRLGLELEEGLEDFQPAMNKMEEILGLRKKFEATNESERKILKNVEILSSVLMSNYHTIMQIYDSLKFWYDEAGGEKVKLDESCR